MTLASRLMGLVRTLVVTTVLGVTFLGNTYATANGIPNLLFEIVAGGALAAVVLPALAASTVGNQADVNRTASAIMNKALIVLTPVVLAGIVFRGPLIRLLTSGVQDVTIRRLEIRLASFLLVIFLPQIWLYCVGVVLTAVLHARHSFVMPALAPMLSSAVVTLSYLLYGTLEGPSADSLSGLSYGGKLVLGLGTTVGVAVLCFSLLPSARQLGFRWHPVLKIPEPAAKRIQSLALPALATVAAQQVVMAIVLVIANRVEGGVVAYQLAFTILLVFWAIFPLPIATTLFPGLASAATENGRGDFAVKASSGGKKVIPIVFGATALMFSTSAPLAGLVLTLRPQSLERSLTLVTLALASFAPGLVGYGLYAYFTRASYALGDGRSAAIAAVVGFGIAGSANLAAAMMLDGTALVAALAASFSGGALIASLILILRFRNRAGTPAVAGLGASAARGLVSALPAGGLGALVAAVLPSGGLGSELVRIVLSGLSVLLAYIAMQHLVGDSEVKAAVNNLRHFLLRRQPGAES